MIPLDSLPQNQIPQIVPKKQNNLLLFLLLFVVGGGILFTEVISAKYRLFQKSLTNRTKFKTFKLTIFFKFKITPTFML